MYIYIYTHYTSYFHSKKRPPFQIIPMCEESPPVFLNNGSSLNTEKKKQRIFPHDDEKPQASHAKAMDQLDDLATGDAAKLQVMDGWLVDVIFVFVFFIFFLGGGGKASLKIKICVFFLT